MNNIMLDLETMSTKNNAVIVSIGAVFFDKRELGDEFYIVLDVREQQQMGRHISADTMRWWLDQSAEARSVFKESGVAAAKGLLMFNEFVSKSSGRPIMWGNGSDFDNAILGSLHDDLGMPRPWSFSDNRCYRTLKNVVQPVGNLPIRAGTYHNALDDAKYQAECAGHYLRGKMKGM
jgi:exodeoxyribonuclease VIII